MKYLLVTALILMVFWLWRHNRQAPKNTAPPPRTPASADQATGIAEMVACSVCQVHLPKSEALIGHGKTAHYCSEAHRREAGD
jgi:uncharacterized protein